MMQDIVDQICENAVKAQHEYLSMQLERLGFSTQYVKEHRYDFIAVCIYLKSDGHRVGADYTYYEVYVPTGQILFAFTRCFHERHTDDDRYEVYYTFEQENPHDVTPEVLKEIQRCAKQAREQALELLK